MRLIDADALKADYGMKDDCADCEKELQGKVRSCEYDHIYSTMDFCGWIDDAQTIDAVEVVRCKDCRWWHKKADPSNQGYCYAARHGHYSKHWEIQIIRTYEADFFCADGELMGESDE